MASRMRREGYVVPIVPCLLAANADLERIEFGREVAGESRRRFDLTDHVEHLGEWIRAYQARLIVIDPMNAFIGSDVDDYKESSVRRALTPLVCLAQSERVAIVMVRHWGKSSNRNVTHRGLGSIGFSAVARSIVQFGRHPTEAGMYVAALGKTNLASKDSSITYRIESRFEDFRGKPIKSSGIVWGEVSDLTAADLSGESLSREERFMQSEIAKLITTELKDRGGTAQAAEMHRLGLKLGYSSSAMGRARQRLGINSRKVGSPQTGDSMWVWEIDEKAKNS